MKFKIGDKVIQTNKKSYEDDCGVVSYVMDSLIANKTIMTIIHSENEKPYNNRYVVEFKEIFGCKQLWMDERWIQCASLFEEE